MSDLLTSNQAARLLGLSKSTLEHWRTVRKGPPFVRVGPRCIRYRRADLDAWLSGQLVDVS